ncbi:MAG: S-ribosylhomocysteine lyase [Lachnospiraceae bacterium]|nr:S-ribosylhomocysteine lyase [Lachnospiraceae bacterium]
MDKITSFTIDHLRLQPGLYVSRLDRVGQEPVTTFDLRFTAPNWEPVLDMPAVHTIEHLGATFLRNSEEKSHILYFGPMGCRTGFYLLMAGKRTPQDILPLIREMCSFILNFEGEIPGARPEECGNYSEQNLNMAKYYTKRYLDTLIRGGCFDYPQGGEEDGED